jgi:diaminohydroxyphosphoribosylaminopyrimidine deaminase / 5-amino-6-(5-phosphoribosylamino)uracil reductase
MELTKERASLKTATDILPAMSLALTEAQKFEGATAPNPPVGCVLLDKSGNVLSVAAHQKAGTLHAEALAIKQCAERELIHTVVVTLEPCNHTGRTGPCTEAILSTPAKNVWIGMADPNPHVAGGGADRLREAGLNVQFLNETNAPKLKSDLRRLIAPFTKRTLHGLPWVTIKQAVDTQGSMIPPAGQKTFTSQTSLVLAHQLRRRADAVITGSGTVLADDPHFTVRLVEDFADKKRHLVLFDRRRRIPKSYLDAATSRGFKVSFADDLPTTLKYLAEQGTLEVLVEAGPALTQSFLDSNLWDEHVLITKGDPDQIQIFQNKESHVFRNH